MQACSSSSSELSRLGYGTGNAREQSRTAIEVNEMKKKLSTQEQRVPIPAKTRYELWASAGGHCEFPGCPKQVGRDFLTKARAYVGEVAHIVADSRKGPRGSEDSKALAADPSNLMLLCFDCHKRIDADPETYAKAVLLEMKARHEKWVETVYGLNTAQVTTPVLLRVPVNRHMPHFSVQDARVAVLKNSSYRCVPADGYIEVDERRLSLRDHQADFWNHLQRELPRQLDAQLGQLTTTGELSSHLSVFAFGPMPLLILAGYILGNKRPTTVYQWSRNSESWLWDRPNATSEIRASWTAVPSAATVAVALSISATVDRAAVEAAVPAVPIVEFSVASVGLSVVTCEDDVLYLRKKLTELVAALHEAGVTRIELFPATPLSVCVEFGRLLLPKAHPTVRIWDYQNRTSFIETLLLA